MFDIGLCQILEVQKYSRDLYFSIKMFHINSVVKFKLVINTVLFTVTECEIQDGILKATDVESHVLVYRRELTFLDQTAISDQDFSRFVDVKKIGEVLF